MNVKMRQALAVLRLADICLPLRSVDTPVANRPREATAKEPPRSTKHDCQPQRASARHVSRVSSVPMLAIVPPWRMFKRFYIECQWWRVESRQGIESQMQMVASRYLRYTYCMLLLNIQFKVDSSRPSCSDTELDA